MTRPIGTRIIQVCKIVEMLGECGSHDVQIITGVVSTNTIKYLSRAVGHGLLSVDRSSKPHRYQIVDGWREMVAQTKKTEQCRPELSSRFALLAGTPWAGLGSRAA